MPLLERMGKIQDAEVLRASCGLLSKDLLDTDERARLADYIDRVPSFAARAELWADLAPRN